MKQKPQWKHSAYIVLGAMAMLGLWIVFTFSVGRDELIVGAACSILASGFAVFVALREPTPFRPSPANVLEFWRLPWYVVTDTMTVVRASLRPMRRRGTSSLYRAVPFTAGGSHGKHDTARRVLAVAYTTVTPNSIAIGIDTRRGLLLFHQLVRSPVSRMMRNLGALK